MMAVAVRTGLSLMLAAGMWASAVAQGPVLDLQNTVVDPLPGSGGSGAFTTTVVLFLSTECPISNRYAPAIQGLHTKFADRGIRFWLVYPHPGDSVADIRNHIGSYGFPGRPMRDPDHTLVRAAGVTVTPEAALFDATGTLRYRGRIDDRYTDFGVDRQTPSRRDLEDAVAAVLAGRPVPEPVTRAVGCFLADLP